MLRHPFRMALALGALYALLAVLFGALAAVLWQDMTASEREAARTIVEPRLPLSIFIILLAWGLLGALVGWLYRAYALAPARLREQVQLLVGSNPQWRLDAHGAPELRALASTINTLADQRDALRHDVNQMVEQAKASVEAERNRLAALMSELTQSVVVCNLDGRILLYNQRARLQFQVLGPSSVAGPGAVIGLGRSIFALMERQLITHALESVQLRLSRGSAQPAANFVTSTRAGQLIRVQLAPVFAQGEGARSLSGYVLLLDNITKSAEAQGRRDLLLQTLSEGNRAALGTIRAAVENLQTYSDMEASERDRFVGIVAEEVAAMGQRLEQVGGELAETQKTRWPLEDMLAVDLLQAAQRRIEQRLALSVTLEAHADELWIRVDSFSLLQGLCHLAEQLKHSAAVDAVALRVQALGRLVQLDLLWAGEPLDAARLAQWEAAPVGVGGEGLALTLREVMERHGGELWSQRDSATPLALVRMVLPAAQALDAAEASVWLRSDSRPEYYDFDLFAQGEEALALDERPLAQLRYTVFDTETTGLAPSEGDEIIQIGALHVVNGRLLRQEAMDQLMDPHRRLNPASIPIHGITDDMLRGQPGIEQVLPVFHSFCEDTVLVAHNAAFDMRFLQMKQASTGVVFAQPVLDTLLLSAVLHPNQESHRLEAIAERLGVHVVGRHTALGDAIVTAEIFLKMLPLLAAQGIHTLGQARAASAQTRYARTQY